jgi:hypothetical protein
MIDHSKREPEVVTMEIGTEFENLQAELRCCRALA